jgi:uncharacterized membrane protein
MIIAIQAGILAAVAALIAIAALSGKAGRAEKKTTEPASGKEETSGTAAPAGGRLFLPAGKEEEAETVVTIYQRRKAWPVRICPVCGTENGLTASACNLCGQNLTKDIR